MPTQPPHPGYERSRKWLIAALYTLGVGLLILVSWEAALIVIIPLVPLLLDEKKEPKHPKDGHKEN